jgi:hypothetical protein
MLPQINVQFKIKYNTSLNTIKIYILSQRSALTAGKIQYDSSLLP